ncbi:hypothetical protein [Actinopolymorpha pittospori]|uniref:Uncharacterized protein n=1 Tax=Actinopolymorpha pittospori TaxID=648752 RepID=A0A927RBC3_9ACTN|nr:hypothetical protein [Actinopolymorpha pittospori]MBE1609992.1 hypothetical protein [Actinopolymorpha pittospori]
MAGVEAGDQLGRLPAASLISAACGSPEGHCPHRGGLLVGGLTGFTVEGTAERNAWEATCADLQRRTSAAP